MYCLVTVSGQNNLGLPSVYIHVPCFIVWVPEAYKILYNYSSISNILLTIADVKSRLGKQRLLSPGTSSQNVKNTVAKNG